MRLLICAGGTGGGVYPAIAVLQAVINKFIDLSSEEHRIPSDIFQRLEGLDLSVLWVGSIGGMETDLIKRTSIPYNAIPAAGIHGVGLRLLPKNVWELIKGFQKSKRIIKTYPPDVLFFTGGYVAIPMALASRKYPSLLYIPDIEPGLSLKIASRFADEIAVTTDDSKKFFNSHPHVTVTGYPIRSNLMTWSKEQAYELFDLQPNINTLLVFGGSKGAHSINRALFKALPELLKAIQVIHISGELDWPEAIQVREKISDDVSLADRYRAYPYLHEEMGAALIAADLVLSRAGASTLGEFPVYGLPAILVPYPYAWRYQQVNAEYLERKGAASILPDDQLEDSLLNVVTELITDRLRLKKMGAEMSSLARSDSATSIAELLIELAHTKKKVRK